MLNIKAFFLSIRRRVVASLLAACRAHPRALLGITTTAFAIAATMLAMRG